MSQSKIAASCTKARKVLEALKTTGTTHTGKDEWEYTVEIGEFFRRLGIMPKDVDTKPTFRRPPFNRSSADTVNSGTAWLQVTRLEKASTST